MKVRELIERLQQCNPESRVVMYRFHDSYSPIHKVDDDGWFYSPYNEERGEIACGDEDYEPEEGDEPAVLLETMS